MFAALPAFLRPSTFLHALRANLTTEPKVLFVYALLLLVPWVVWQGLRTGEAEPYDRGESPEDGEAGSGRKPKARRDRRKPRPRKEGGRRRPKGGINWIQ